jgi:hypothetical protein
VDGSGTGYLKTVCDYVHFNLARANLLKPEQALREYEWSSRPEYLKSSGKRWPWLRVDRLLGEYRIPQDSAAGRRYLETQMELRRAAEAGTDHRHIRRGWCLGGEAYDVVQAFTTLVSGFSSRSRRRTEIKKLPFSGFILVLKW